MGIFFGALLADSIAENEKLTGEPSGLGEFMIAQVYGLTKMKKIDQIEKVAN